MVAELRIRLMKSTVGANLRNQDLPDPVLFEKFTWVFPISMGNLDTSLQILLENFPRGSGGLLRLLQEKAPQLDACVTCNRLGPR